MSITAGFSGHHDDNGFVSGGPTAPPVLPLPSVQKTEPTITGKLEPFRPPHGSISHRSFIPVPHLQLFSWSTISKTITMVLSNSSRGSGFLSTNGGNLYTPFQNRCSQSFFVTSSSSLLPGFCPDGPVGLRIIHRQMFTSLSLSVSPLRV